MSVLISVVCLCTHFLLPASFKVDNQWMTKTGQADLMSKSLRLQDHRMGIRTMLRMDKVWMDIYCMELISIKKRINMNILLINGLG